MHPWYRIMSRRTPRMATAQAASTQYNATPTKARNRLVHVL